MRPSFSELYLRFTKHNPYNLETIAQNNLMDLLNKELQDGAITPQLRDSLGRNLIFQCVIFNNFDMLKYLVQQWGINWLSKEDECGITLVHIAGNHLHFHCY